jgi:hypothetical protein
VATAHRIRTPSTQTPARTRSHRKRTLLVAATAVAELGFAPHGRGNSR